MTTLERKTIEAMRGVVNETMMKFGCDYQEAVSFHKLPRSRKSGWLALAKWHLSEMRKRKV